MTPEQANPKITTARVAYAQAALRVGELRRAITAAKRAGDNVAWQLAYNQLGDANRAKQRARRAWTNPMLRF